ncbi:hypothetical protein [Chromobacterium sp.]|uniref:hypothetical protein n=1 Tax=Chromobacterium sp. TaxID=306190 RepID=UPI0035B2D9F1
MSKLMLKPIKAQRGNLCPMRDAYLKDPHVQGFVRYLSEVIKGAIPIGLTVGFSRIKLPADFVQRFGGGEIKGKGAEAVYELKGQTLEAFFRMYWWDRKYYGANAEILESVGAKIRAAIEGEYTADGHAFALEACHEVMKWGFGERTRAYRANMDWAAAMGSELVPVLRLGRESLTGECPKVEVFGRSSDGEPKKPRMNAGWTKYYALALPDFIIYDGRVGAALGFLVRRYLESVEPLHQSLILPESLSFLWASGQGTNLRNPSSHHYKFPRLLHTDDGMRGWARVNLQANWVLAAARHLAQTDWLSGADGLRKLEAALFMLGYDFRGAQ